jgi:hypothetical protein
VDVKFGAYRAYGRDGKGKDNFGDLSVNWKTIHERNISVMETMKIMGR